MIVMDPQRQSAGRRTKIAVIPTPRRTEGVRSVVFEIGGLSFCLKTDQRAFPSFLADIAHSKDPLKVILMPPEDVRESRAILGTAAAAINRKLGK